MRAADREEIFATHFDLGSESDSVYAEIILQSASSGIAWIAYNGLKPVAVLGMNLIWPGVASVWMFATNQWLSVCLSLTKFVKRQMIFVLKDAGIHRAQCWSQDSHDVAHRWLESLGATFETMVPCFGKNRESFCLFSWTEGRDF